MNIRTIVAIVAGAALYNAVLAATAVAPQRAGRPQPAPQGAVQPAPQAAAARGPSARGSSNPKRLTAVQLLEPTRPGLAPHVRFEWDQVPDARAYLLYGRWANAESWTMQSREFRVTPRSATRWETTRVAFDVALPQGSHSWNLVALVGTGETGNFGAPTPLSFELR